MTEPTFPTAAHPAESTDPPAPSHAAAAAFGARLDLAVRYAEILCTRGVERGLIGPREPERIWDRHLLNSVVLIDAIAPAVTVADIGSGAGLPGIPVWLARPDLTMRLVEPLERRVTFLREVVAELEVPIEVVHGRAEQQPPASLDVVIVRALAPLDRLLPLTLPLLRPGGRLLALKGRSASAEIAKANGLLRRWPAARMRWDDVGSGESATVIVQVDLDAASERGGAVGT